MRKILFAKIHAHLRNHHPDLLLTLQESTGVDAYLEQLVMSLGEVPEALLPGGQPWYVVEEWCINEVMENLPPSRYDYLRAVLLEEYGDVFAGWMEAGILNYEIVNLLEACGPVFEASGWPTEEGDRLCRYAIMGSIETYLEEGVTAEREGYGV